MILLLTLLVIKHFVWDFLYQPPYMWQNKGTFLHPGGILHSGLHAVTTYIILTFYMQYAIGALILSCLEFVLHYITDFVKMNLNRRFGWESNTLWILTGLDQLIHTMIYVVILAMIF